MSIPAIDSTSKKPRYLEVNADGKLRVEATVSAEPPVGGATEAKQDVGIAHLATLAVPRTGVNRSGTVAAGGTSQSLMAADANRRGVVFINNSVGSLWINELGAAAVLAQPSVEVKAGAYWETPARFDCRQAWAVIGATTGQSFTCREY